MKKAEVALLGWSVDEAEKADEQAKLSFQHGGHDLQPRTDDRYLLHLAAWLDSIEEDDVADDSLSGSVAVSDTPTPLENITRKTVLEHPILAPRLDALYEKARGQKEQNPSPNPRKIPHSHIRWNT